MAVVSVFAVDAGEFTLGQVLTADLDVEVRVEAVVPTSGQLVPFVWVDGTDVDVFDERVGACERVESVSELDRIDGRTLYRIEWDERSGRLVDALEANRATVLDARGGDRWTFRLRFPTHAALSAFHERCERDGIGLSLVRIGSLEDESLGRPGLTAEQRQALELATERGYFSVPREVTLSELADELGISTQAASERVRRGTDAVLRSTLDGSRRRT